MKATFFLKRPENFEVLESCVHNTHVTQLIWKNETAQVYSFFNYLYRSLCLKKTCVKHLLESKFPGNKNRFTYSGMLCHVDY